MSYSTEYELGVKYAFVKAARGSAAAEAMLEKALKFIESKAAVRNGLPVAGKMRVNFPTVRSRPVPKGTLADEATAGVLPRNPMGPRERPPRPGPFSRSHPFD